jgi:hypothetical protein
MTGSFGPVDRNLSASITYWAPNVYNTHGETTYAAPVLLQGRWMTRIQTVVNTMGQEVLTSAEIFLSDDVAEEGVLAVGDYTDQATPQDLGSANVGIVKSFISQPDLRNMQQERRAYV